MMLMTTLALASYDYEHLQIRVMHINIFKPVMASRWDIFYKVSTKKIPARKIKYHHC
jgi:hypothetical protein